MAQTIACDICTANAAVQMLTNLTDGSVLAMCPACLPEFYGQSISVLTGAGDHAGAPTKCTACKTIHAAMTGSGGPAEVAPPVKPELDPASHPYPETADIP